MKANKEKITFAYLNGYITDDELSKYASKGEISYYDARQLKCRREVMKDASK